MDTGSTREQGFRRLTLPRSSVPGIIEELSWVAQTPDPLKCGCLSGICSSKVIMSAWIIQPSVGVEQSRSNKRELNPGVPTLTKFAARIRLASWELPLLPIAAVQACTQTDAAKAVEAGLVVELRAVGMAARLNHVGEDCLSLPSARCIACHGKST